MIAEQVAPVESSVAAAEHAQRRLPRSLERLEQVRIDSGADAPAGREEVAGLLAEWAAGIGCDVELIPGAGGSTVLARLVGDGGPRVVLLGHHDTVFPAGSAAQLGFAVRDGRALGPGVADMKGGCCSAWRRWRRSPQASAASPPSTSSASPTRRRGRRPARWVRPHPRRRRLPGARVRP